MRRKTTADKKALERYLSTLDTIRASGRVPVAETQAERQARIQRLLKDPIAFAEHYFPHYCTCPCAPFHDEFARWVARDVSWTGFCEWPRGHAKSVWCDIIIPIWLWARGEPMYLVIVGSSYDRAKALLSDTQAEFEANDALIADFGDQRMAGSWEDGYFVTKGGFVGQAIGMGQSVRGLRKQALRPTYIVVDDIETKDLVKNEKRQREMVKWILKDLHGTMDRKPSRLIKANNRFARSMVQTKLQEERPNWHVHHVKAFDPFTYEPTWSGKYTADYWKEKVTTAGRIAVNAEYQHEAHEEGAIFSEDQVNWSDPPRIDHFEALVGHWDIAYAGTKSADYNAVRLWGLKDGKYWLVDCFVKQSKMREAVRWIADKQKAMPESVHVHWRFESQFWNDEVARTIREVEKEAGRDLRLVKVDAPRAAKYDRILSMESYYQNGRIWYSNKLKGHQDTQMGLAQLMGIEPGYNGHDDAPDADEQAIRYLSTHSRVANYAAPILAPERARRITY